MIETSDLKTTTTELNVSNYRPILIFMNKAKALVEYSQGNTSVFVRVIHQANAIGGYQVKSRMPILYSVASNADRINNDEYRKNRRHYEILQFIEAVVSNVGFIENGYTTKKLAICVTSTDGSSRTCAVNAIGAYMSNFERKIQKIPVAISFGVHDGQLKYDLNYIQDSEGEGDCAIAGFYNGGNIYVVSLLYEGAINYDMFFEGIEHAKQSMYLLAKRLNDSK